jgi:hypothetical protein
MKRSCYVSEGTGKLFLMKEEMKLAEGVSIRLLHLKTLSYKKSSNVM